MIWNKIKKENLVFVLIDFQEKFFPILDSKHVELARKNILMMVKMFEKLEIPMIGTDHYRKGLGLTDSKVLEAWKGEPIKDKITFSCCRNDDFKKDFAKHLRDIVIVAGLETHICVLQTVLDLRARGKDVIVIKDACLSSTTLRYENGLDLMKDAGAYIMNAETLLFYILERADTPEFKHMVKLLKENQH